jgi:hypothetical protein
MKVTVLLVGSARGVDCHGMTAALDGVASFHSETS